MSLRYVKIINAALIALLGVLIAFGLARSAVFRRWEHQVQDILFRNFRPELQPENAVIIAIDQSSLDYLQARQILWPWPRDIYGLVTEYLNHCGATVIAYDILFASPDIDRLNSSASHADDAFARQIGAGSKIVLATQLEDSTHASANRLVDGFKVPFEIDVPRQLVRRYPEATLPLPRFQESGAYPGAVNFFSDDDGVCRRLPLLFAYRDRPIPYMALTSAALYLKATEISYDSKQKSLKCGTHPIPLSEKGEFRIYWYGAGGPGQTFPYASFAQVLDAALNWKRGDNPEEIEELFRDKAVFIGATAAGLLDLKPTPFSTIEPYPGVEIYATIFSNIIREDFPGDVPSFPIIAVAIVLLFLLNLAWQHWKVWQAVLISLGAFLLPVILAIILFRVQLQFLPVVSLEMGIILSVLAVLVVNYLTEGREKRLVKTVFNRYLHPAVVDHLTEHPDKVEMGGQEIEATVLFTDLQGFTGISEQFNPREIVSLLNDYFEKVEQIIFKHNGMLDKYTGDGIMAIFGAPLKSADHALIAARAVLDFEQLSNLSVKRANRSVPFITRVGVNSGSLIVGNIGSSNRMDYTAIGDTVNLSARLEGVNKIYGTQNMISEYTYRQVKAEMICRELDYIRVKGREQPLSIYTILDEMKNMDNQMFEFLSMHTKALQLYRAREYDAAAEKFKKVLALMPQDRVARVFVDRCRQLQHNPELVDDEGVFNITVK